MLEAGACVRWLISWPPKKLITKLKDNDTIADFAPSLEEADAILAATGYAERELAAA